MKEEQLNINEIMKVETLPVIFYKLEEVGKYIDNELEKVKDLECTEANKQEVKNIRTGINNTLTEFEDKKKEMKNQILDKYNQFNDKYEEEVKSKLKNTSETLTNQINIIENKQKLDKENELRTFYDRYAQEYKINEIVKFENVGLNITLSASETALKKQVTDFLEKIMNDIQVITNEDINIRDEIMLEYQNNGFDYSKAKLAIIEKHQRLLDIQQKIKEQEQKHEEESYVIENIESLVSAPIEIKENDEEETEEEIVESTFTITTTTSKIKALKQWLKDNEVEYK